MRANPDGRFLSATRLRGWLLGLLLVVAIVLVYHPAWHGGLLWDDDMHITNNRMLVEPGGLKQIWSSPDSPQYYPLVFTSFRIERSLWGLNPTGYHWVNLLLHAASAVLVWRVLRRLNMPGAWLAGAVFALHPVNVESVAWISQRKNTLAMFFYLLSGLLYLRFDQQSKVQSLKSKVGSPESKVGSPESKVQSPKSKVNEEASRNGGRVASDTQRATHNAPGVSTPPPSALDAPSSLFGQGSRGRSPSPASLFYWLSLIAFVLALLSKTAVSPFPLVLLGLAWWRRGRVVRRDVWRSAPFFAASLVLGLLTVWFERHQTSLEFVRDDSFWSRLGVAGRAVWFYLYKALLPLNVMPIYPRWRTDATYAWTYVPGLLLAGVLLLLWWKRRRWGRVWLFGAGYYVVMLLPVLGFVNIGFMKYSLVADHWQYFSMIGPIALVSAGVAMAMGMGSPKAEVRRPKSKVQSPEPPSPLLFPLQMGGGRRLLGATLCGAVLVTLGALSWRQCAIYTDAETFWRAVVAANPGCGQAHFILGDCLTDEGRLDEAIAQYQQALEILPGYAYAHNNLGNALCRKDRLPEAMAHYRKALELQPDLAWANCNLGVIYLEQGQVDEAIAEFQQALQTGLLMFNKPMFAPAGVAKIHSFLARALLRKGRGEEALTQYREALALQPELAEAHYQLAAALQSQHQPDEASRHYREAIRLKPDWVEALNNLSWLLATQPDARFRDGKQAAELAARAVVLTHTNDAKLLDTLGAALAEAGRFPEALDAARTAARLAQAAGAAQLGREIEAHRQCYERGQPFREPSAPDSWPSPKPMPP
jgi:tetratricopeptide (TPR) repeat protein